MRAVTEARRRVIWTGTDEPRAEACRIELGPEGVRASGVQVSFGPAPYRLDYSLDASEGFVTRRLEIECSDAAGARRFLLEHDSHGTWRCEPEADAASELSEALDCDLGLSPLTNLMPVRRHRLHEGPGSAEIVVAWVSVPDLDVHASRQRYEHVRRTDEGSIVRFVDLGLHEGFTADLELDHDGLIVAYPDLAQRIVS